MTYRDTIKRYFETGDFPTQAQFWEFFDKIPFLDEGFAARITGLPGQNQIPVPAGTWIDKIGIVGNTEIIVGCGTVNGTEDVFTGEDINGNGSVNKDVYFPANGTLYFTGITPTTIIILFTR